MIELRKVSSKILIVEDDHDLQKVLENLLKNESYITQTASTGAEAFKKIEKLLPDLVLLDLGLPDIQGETVLTQIREDYPELPVIILTAKSKPEEIAKGLNLGAADYLPKPFAAEELVARIKTRLKESGDTQKSKLKVGELVLDLNQMVAKRDGKVIDLTQTEFNLLKFMMVNAGRVLNRDMILNHVWDYSADVESRVVDVYIGYLRKKIDKCFSKKMIKNKRGFGYTLLK